MNVTDVKFLGCAAWEEDAWSIAKKAQRRFLSTYHCAPQSSHRIFTDVTDYLSVTHGYGLLTLYSMA